jgi:ankyrin repeat protein
MPSKTAMLNLVKTFRWREVAAALDASPALLDVRDARGRNWLHVCCGVAVQTNRTLRAVDSIRLAKCLLERGFELNGPAFAEGTWQATPLWYAIARGRNLPLAKFLLAQGADPNHCLWAAGFRDDATAIGLLLDHGADIDPVTEDATPFLEAVKWSHFVAAGELLKRGANVDFQDSKGMTALHYMLKKGSDISDLKLLVKHGARGDIADAAGATATQILRRKRDPALRALAAQLR